MTDIVKLRTGYAVKVSVLRVGFAGPPGADGSAYDDTPILARITAVEQLIAALPTPYDYAALAGRVAALEGASASVAWIDIVGKPAAFPPTAHRHDASQIDNLPVPAWADITGKPSAFPPTTHQHSFADIMGLTTALAAKADAATVLTLEAIQDAVAAMFQGGTHTNAAITYDDASGTLSITASGGGGASLTQEEVEDFVGGLIVQGKGINVTYDDAGNVLSIALSGEIFTTAEKNKLAGIAPGATANATDAQLRDRSTHTGTQPISSVSGLQTALDGKAPASHTHPYSEITGKPSVFPPAAHSHPWSDLTGVPTAFPPSAHPHTIGDVSGLQTALNAKLDDSQATPTGLAVLGAVNQAAARDALGVPREQIDVFDTAGTFTWQKPAWASRFLVHLIGGGGGGGGGASGTNTAVRAGGGGGGAGMVSRWEFSGTEYTSTCTIVVGAGGNGGNGGNSGAGGAGAGSPGVTGEDTDFRLNNSIAVARVLVASGGGRGNGGGTTGTGGVGGAIGTFGGISNPGGNGGTTGAGAAGSNANLSVAGGGGGGGGGKSTAGVVGAGGGGSIGFAVGGGGGRTVAGTAGGASSGGAGVNGADPSYVLGAGAGGSGGGSSTTTVGGKGGNGGAGAGGGGGGSAMDTFLAGSGGHGGDGRAVIISYEV